MDYEDKESDIEKEEDNFKLTDINWDVLKFVLMIGLIITMLVLSFFLWKYGSAIKSNPCEFCNCTRVIYGGLFN